MAHVSWKVVKAVQLNARMGMGRKRDKCIETLHSSVLSANDCLRELGGKIYHYSFSSPTNFLLRSFDNDSYNALVIETTSEIILMDTFEDMWMLNFSECYCLVSGTHTGMGALSPTRQKEHNGDVLDHFE